jgi:hypothetical protein
MKRRTATAVYARWRIPAAIVAAALVLTSCATEEVPVATGGSKAGGTIDMSFEFGAFEAPKVDWYLAQQTAKQRCGAWGYTDADAFGGANTQCVAANAYGCLRTRVTMTYQCTDAQGAPEAAKDAPQAPAAAQSQQPAAPSHQQSATHRCGGLYSPSNPNAVTCD